MLAPRVVENAILRRAADAAGGYLGDVDVGVFVVGVVNVLGYGESDGGVGDGLAEEPGYTLLVGLSDGEVIAVKEVLKRLPSGGYGRSHRRGICSEGMSALEEGLNLRSKPSSILR